MIHVEQKKNARTKPGVFLFHVEPKRQRRSGITT